MQATHIRGYALALVLVTLSLVAVVLATLGVAIRGSLEQARQAVSAEEARQGAHGAARLAAVAANDAFVDAPGAAGFVTMRRSICDGGRCDGAFCSDATCAAGPRNPLLPGFVGEGLKVERLTLTEAPGAPGTALADAPLAAPFSALSGVRTGATVRVDVRSLRTRAVARAAVQMRRERMPLSVFRGWAAAPAVIFADDDDVYAGGRFHAEGLLCAGARPGGGRADRGVVDGLSSSGAVAAGVAVAGDCRSSPGHIRLAGFGDFDGGALDRYGDRVAVGTPPLLPPLGETATPGSRTRGGARALLEPPARDDGALARQARLARLADLRIWNGVWYVAPLNRSFPGVPIWSDHPGRRRTSAEERLWRDDGRDDVGLGQADLFSAGSTPKLFSRYEARPDGVVDDDGNGVVFYGGVDDGAVAWVDGTGAHPVVDNQDLLEAGRSGFVDPHERRPVLPLNFDVGAFSAALASSGANELGVAFTRAAGKPVSQFNGVIWIGNSYDGSDDGRDGDGDAPDDVPLVDDDLQPAAGPGRRRALPRPLCSDSLADNAVGAGFHVPACARGQVPNAVRLVNASRIARAGGLTIATHLPLYVVGDVNAVDKKSVMLAGDRLTLLGRRFSDGLLPLGRDADENAGSADRDVVVNAALLVGAPARGGLLDFSGAVRVGDHGLAVDHTGSLLIVPALLATATRSRPAPSSWRWQGETYASPQPASGVIAARQPPGMPYAAFDATYVELP